uniref:non-specific serine/threonine protein kinase n=1 Tax=viral metagenome TaxID=1070528 RepID=A0A6C0IFU6_9ZZZZ
MTALIGKKYILLDLIGSGSFGSIYQGINVRTEEKVAIKVEPINNGTKLLKNETTIYQYLSNKPGIPEVKWYGKDNQNYYMVLNLLGESLEAIKEQKGTFSLKTTLQIGINVLDLLLTIHEAGLIHRDIKPDNFLLSLTDTNKKINIIDFGLCKSYLNNEKHMEMKKTSSLIGTPTYASVNAHNFMELSRRDDLESLGYMLIYFYLGQLDWQKIDSSDHTLIKEMKANVIYNSKIPPILIEYIKFVRSIEFEEKPYYHKLFEIFKREIDKIAICEL